MTIEVTAKATAEAAKANAKKPGKVIPAFAILPKLPGKMDVNDDPLAGMPTKDIKGKAGRKQ